MTDFHPGKRLGELCSCEPLLYAAAEHREVGVPLNVLHPRVSAGGHVPTSVQRLQPKRVVPVELPEGEKKGVKWFDRGLMVLQNDKLETYHLVPHLYNVFIAVIESKVAVEKRGTSQLSEPRVSLNAPELRTEERYLVSLFC